MIIECTNCNARYQYDEDRFERKPLKKIKCAKCGTIFEIHNPAFAAKPAASEVGESTSARRDDTRTRTKPKVPQETTEETILPPKPSGELALPTGKRLSLAIIDGPDAGTVVRIEKPRVTIGRSNADLVINDTEASRQHAAVEVRDASYVVVDLKSTNGTMVDGRRISEPTELQDKAEFQIGSTVIMLIVTEDT